LNNDTGGPAYLCRLGAIHYFFPTITEIVTTVFFTFSRDWTKSTGTPKRRKQSDALLLESWHCFPCCCLFQCLEHHAVLRINPRAKEKQKKQHNVKKKIRFCHGVLVIKQ
jgi:hypothetical protein